MGCHCVAVVEFCQHLAVLSMDCLDLHEELLDAKSVHLVEEGMSKVN